jgi:hypothetical protein
VRRLLIAVGLLVSLVGILVCWPLARLLLTHEHGRAQVRAVYRDRLANGDERLRAVWEVETSPGRYALCDAQSNQFFHPIPDPVVRPGVADAIETRLLPDAKGRQLRPLVFWRANDPAGSAFIIDVSETHWWRRYVAGLSAIAIGLVTARLAWAYARRSA